jgi:hypothetical protein
MGLRERHEQCFGAVGDLCDCLSSLTIASSITNRRNNVSEQLKGFAVEF